MAYDERLAQRLREVLYRTRGLTEKPMFGGIAFLLRGRMCCGVNGGDLVVRVGPQAYEAALARPHARPMDFTGRALTGFVYVGPRGTARKASLEKWVAEALAFARSLPAKRGR